MESLWGRDFLHPSTQAPRLLTVSPHQSRAEVKERVVTPPTPQLGFYGLFCVQLYFFHYQKTRSSHHNVTKTRNFFGTILVIFYILQHYQNFIRYSWPWCAVSKSKLAITFNRELRGFNNRFYILHASDPSRQAYSRSAGQNIPRLSLKFKVYCRLFANSVPVISMLIPSSYIPCVF